MEVCSLTVIAVVVVLGFILNRFLRSLRINRYSYALKYVLITGCDTGFGNITAKKLYQMGFNVFAACLTEAGKEELVQFANNENKSNKMIPFSMDVTKTESIKEGYSFVEGQIPHGKGLWGLVNNAGIAGPVGGIEFFTKAHYQRVLDVNALGMFDVTTHFLPLLKIGKGRIVNTASIMGRLGFAGIAPYCVSKYAVEAFSDSARRQLKLWGVSVHIVEPGFFRTNITDLSLLEENYRKTFYGADPKVIEEYGQEFFKETMEVQLKKSVVIANKNIHLVRDAYIHALTAVYPYVRYYVGPDAHLFYIPLAFLPGAIQDKIFAVLSKPPLPAALKKKK
ncbi:retinol dehydrogenase 7 [Lingula anatina]|uniref:Retinol dehydrogenase 7 n=1 Tax=Lingula anatina TaxID=7574 RepID=A0A1S3HNU0_LINAN|nr:retinol dehydrogenase 7 [Lingula anatina]XP_013387724.1 retinol dehydrogenase 7 [Lingula anatina]|eukprot:XP_013387723.1 retinol dehydrogenase 7 [Lingula anatina]